ncbi:MAG: membrane protein insertase YidC, partial [Myxococcota bacterium]
MDRRTLIAIASFIGLYWAYMFLWPMIWPAEPLPEEATEQSVAADGTADPAAASTDTPSAAGTPATAGTDTPAAPPVVSTVPSVTETLDACGMDAKVVSTGGYLRDGSLREFQAPYDVTPVYSYVLGLFTGEGTTWDPYGPEPGAQGVATAEARMLTMGAGALGNAPADVLIEKSGEKLVLTGTTASGVRVQRTLSAVEGEPCVLKVEATWTNPGSTAVDGPVWLAMHDELPELANAYEHAQKPYWSVDEAWNSYTYPHSGGYMGMYQPLTTPVRYDGDVDWFGFSDGYFSFVAVPTGENSGRLVVSPLASGRVTEEGLPITLYGHHYVIDGLAAGASVTETFDIYVGPNHSAVLSEVHPTLYYLVDLGWFAFFGRPLLWLLELYYSVVGNWGISIILLTVTIKLVFFPLTQTAYKSSQRMAAVQPKLKEVRAKYADNQEELNKQTMALFKENKVNPLGGCLPMVIQMPIWISLYRVLLTSVDLYHTEFLYLKDLSVMDPYSVLPVIVVALMFGQQQLMPTTNMDPNQARIMKFMPLVFGLLFFSFP